MTAELRSRLEECQIGIASRGQKQPDDTFLSPHLWEQLRQRLQGAYRRATGETHAVLSVDAPAPAELSMGWQSMETAPFDGKHCILAIKTGAFVYSIQGAFTNGKWQNAADIDSEPLAWMPNVRLPAEFCPWTDEYKARAALSASEVEG